MLLQLVLVEPADNYLKAQFQPILWLDLLPKYAFCNPWKTLLTWLVGPVGLVHYRVL